MGVWVERVVLLAAMVVGSFLMWTAVPAAWLWIAGRFSRVSQSDMTSIVIVMTGIPATMVFVARGLGRLDARYTKRFGPETESRIVRTRWLQSLRGETEHDPITILDKIVVVNVLLALIAAATWFVLFSGGALAPA